MAKRGIEYLNGATKRRLDLLCVAALGGAGVAFAPLTAAVYAAACIDNRTLRPFFHQVRRGQGGKPIEVVKLRTLYDRSENSQFLGTYDPRASFIGRCLRRTGVDELPQLLNVVKGEMSFMSPSRPYPDKVLNMYQDADPTLFADWQANTSQVKPGLYSTSAGYRHNLPPEALGPEVFKTSMRLDIEDVQQASLAWDLRLLSQLPRVILQREQTMLPSPLGKAELDAPAA